MSEFPIAAIGPQNHELSRLAAVEDQSRRTDLQALAQEAAHQALFEQGPLERQRALRNTPQIPSNPRAILPDLKPSLREDFLANQREYIGLVLEIVQKRIVRQAVYQYLVVLRRRLRQHGVRVVINDEEGKSDASEESK